MDLTQGICVLCTKNTKIIVPPQAEDTTFLLKDIIGDQINEKFDNVNSSLKVCPGCLHDLLTVADLKKNIKKDFSKDNDNCTLCYSDQHLVSIANCSSFDKGLKNVTSEKIHGKSSACLNCIKCLDLLERIKMNLLRKYPHLKHTYIAREKKSRRPPTKNNADTHTNKQENEHSSKEKYSLDGEPENISQSRINVNNPMAALKHLKPLKNTQFALDEFKADKKLLKQIAFVKLSISSLSSMNYRKLDVRSNTSKKSNKLLNLSDTDSSRDSPSPKQSFFKIKLKVNSTKVKSQRVAHGKVTKPKAHKRKPLSDSKKELIVRIIKMNLDELTVLDQDCQEAIEITTPTKASRKMMPEDSVSSSKKRKSVTFADVLDSDITDVPSRKDNVDATPLKSLLKKNDLPKSGLFKNGNGGSSDESDNELNKEIKQAEQMLDSEEELETTKSYVEDILKHNDDIFDSLKTSENTVSAKVPKSKIDVDSSSNSDSDDQEIKKYDDKTAKSSENKELNEVEKRAESKSMEVDNSNSENEEDTAKNEEKKSNNKKERTKEKSTEFTKNGSGNSSDSDVNEHRESGDEETKSNAKNNAKDEDIELAEEVEEEKGSERSNTLKDNGEIINGDDTEITTKSKNSKLKNKKDKKIHSRRSKKSKGKNTEIHKDAKQSKSIRDSNLEESPTDKDSDGEDLSKNDDCIISSAEKNEFESSNGEHEISLSKCLADKSSDDQSTSWSSSMEDREVTLEEFKKRKFITLEEFKKRKNSNSCETILNNSETTNDSDINEDKEDECQHIDNKQISDTELDADMTNKEDTTECNNLSTKTKRIRRRTIERQENDEEALNINKDMMDSDGPETKRQKVSEGDDLSDNDSEKGLKAAKTINEDASGVPEKNKDVDDKMDELIAQYTNPSIPKLYNDNNVSDSQDAGLGGEDQETRYQASSNESKEALNLDTNSVMARSTENVAVENWSGDIIDSDVPDSNNVTLNGLNFDNILDHTVDSC